MSSQCHETVIGIQGYESLRLRGRTLVQRSLRGCVLRHDTAIRNRPRSRQLCRCSTPQRSFELTRRELLTLTGLATSLPLRAEAFEDFVEPETQLTEVPFGLSITAAKNSVPSHWYPTFQKLIGFKNRVKFKTMRSFEDIYQKLSDEKFSDTDLVTIGDAWLTPAIKHGYITPFTNPIDYRWFETLPRRWQRFVRRDSNGELSNMGQIWAVPYRWGITAIAYKQTKLLKSGMREIEDWADLLQPGLRHRIAWSDSPREFVGLTLKSLGLSFNAGIDKFHDKSDKGEQSLRQAKERLDAFKQQTLLFSNVDHVRALLASDAWVCVGTTLDLLPLRELVSDLKIIIPKAGSSIWADFFVIPSYKHNESDLFKNASPMTNAWLDYVLSPARSREGQAFKYGFSPLDLPGFMMKGESCSGDGELDPKGRFLPNVCMLSRSEFALPLDKDMHAICELLLTEA